MKEAKIFISSTFKDLQQYRKNVIAALEQMGIEVLAMEKFGGYPNEATSVCNSVIDECSIFVGIYGFYYGYCPSIGGSSITEQEYDYARNKGKPCLCYFAHDSLRFVSPVKGDENMLQTLGESGVRQKKMDSFKSKIDSELVRGTFKSIDGLCKIIMEDIKKILDGEPIGMVYYDVVGRLFELEKKQRKVICDWHFDKQAHHFNYKSPLDQDWFEFIKIPAWHDRLRDMVQKISDKKNC